jgi:hypothetical protein
MFDGQTPNLPSGNQTCKSTHWMIFPLKPSFIGDFPISVPIEFWDFLRFAIAAGPCLNPWQAAQAAYPGAARTESRDGAPELAIWGEILTVFFFTAHILVAKSYEMPHKISIFHGVDVFI